LRTTSGTDFIGKYGKYGLPILSVVLLILNGVNTFVLYPTNAENLAVTMLGVYLAPTIITFWLDRKKSAEKSWKALVKVLQDKQRLGVADA